MSNPVIIFGAGAFGKMTLDVFNSQGVLVYGFLDDDTALHNQEINGIPILGGTDSPKVLKQIGKKCDAFVASDNNIAKKKLSEQIMTLTKFSLANAIHSAAVLPAFWQCGMGNLIGAGCLIGADVKIGNFCILNAGAILESSASLSHYVQVGAGAVLGANVEVAEGAFIGAGAILIAGIKVGKNARVGAGAVVIQDVSANQTVFGNPAAVVK